MDDQKQTQITAFELTPVEVRIPVPFQEAGRKFRVTHIFRPALLKDWLEYENRLHLQVEREGNAQRWYDDREEASEAIWNEIVIGVEGYLCSHRRTDGAYGAPATQEIMETFPDDWKERVPVDHKVAAISRLARVEPCQPGEEQLYFFDSTRQTVYLEARRDGLVYSGLVHVLRRPALKEKKNFRRIQSSVLHVRGSRKEQSRFPSRLKEFTQFYDELILEVDGYTVSGRPATREDAVRWMDPQHKRAAVISLFAPELDDEQPAAPETE